MTKKTSLWLLAGLLILMGYWLIQYLQPGQNEAAQTNSPVFLSPSTQPQNSSADTPELAKPTTAHVNYKLEAFVSNLTVPWSLVFTNSNRILVTERPGKVRVVENGQLLPEPIRVFSEVSSQAEEGLMGMALDPNYDKNRWLYICLAYEKNGQRFNKLVRVTDQNDQLNQDLIILDQIPSANFHAGCRVRIGPDEKLYISTGDATNKQIAQNPTSLGGKILRLNLDGTIPADNPFPNSLVYSLGHRNPQGFDWHPATQALIATEHGPSGFDGPGGGDEVNLILGGKNYGWPDVSHDKSKSGMQDPLIIFTPAVAPASGMFYRGQVFPQLTNVFLFGMLRGEGIMQIKFNPSNPAEVVLYQKLNGINVGRVREIVEGPDGLIYFTTSNKDGRGKANTGDDKIYRLVPNN